MMSQSQRKSGAELFIVDNADDDWKVQNYLHTWCGIGRAFDIATAHLKKVQAPQGIRSTLLAWMELI